MILHLGNDCTVRDRDIVGVFDMENTTVAKSTREFLSRNQKEGSVINVTYDLPRSFCLTTENGKEKVYISQLAPSTLKKRGTGL